jgi:hypothetical protein
VLLQKRKSSEITIKASTVQTGSETGSRKHKKIKGTIAIEAIGSRSSVTISVTKK